MGEPFISVIIPCRNEGGSVRRTLNSILRNSGRLPDRIIVVDNGSTDGCCDFLRANPRPGISLLTTGGINAGRARNAGAAEADGGILVFCDPRVDMEENWLDKLAETLQLPGVDAVSPAIRPHPPQGRLWGGLTWAADMTFRWLKWPRDLTAVPVLPGACLAVNWEAFSAVHGFEDGFRGYGYEDIEFSLKLWLWGFGAYVDPRVKVSHMFGPTRPCPVNGADADYNLLRLAVLHFNQERLGKAIAMVKNRDHFPGIFTDIILGDAPEKRQEYMARRKYDDDWFVKKFNLG